MIITLMIGFGVSFIYAEDDVDDEPVKETVHATSIDIDDFEKTMKVGATQKISASIYPSDAEDKLYYYSLNKSVATVSQNGKISAVGAGTTIITVRAGNVTRTLTLTVNIETQGITLNSTYIVLKKGKTFQLKAKVKPSNAEQKLTYSSTDTSVATVSNAGLIRAKKEGSASIIVSNGFLSTSANLIVNTKGTGYSNSISYVGSVGTTELKKYSKSGETVVINNKDYEIILAGSDIVNPDNELNGELNITTDGDGFTFDIGGDNAFLPGEITVKFKNSDMRTCNYVYLMDKSTDKYQMFGKIKKSEFKTDLTGKYKITYEKIKESKLNIKAIIIASAIIVLIALGYFIYKRFI